MRKVVSMADIYPLMEETLRAGGLVTITSTGTSMLPMLRDRRDKVVLEPVSSRLHANDVALYRRDSGQFVLHRVVGMEPNGDYILCGDNQFVLEHHIAHRQVIGCLQAFTHNGRYIPRNSSAYRTYVHFLPVIRMLKHGIYTGRRYLGALKRCMHKSRNK